MKNIFLFRTASTSFATFGHMVDAVSSHLHLVTLELPDRKNQRNISCIPIGSYLCKYEHHKKKGCVYRLKDVEGRDGILIHTGNYPEDTEGCILIGLTMKYPDMIMSSQTAIVTLHNHCQSNFTLHIVKLL